MSTYGWVGVLALAGITLSAIAVVVKPLRENSWFLGGGVSLWVMLLIFLGATAHSSSLSSGAEAIFLVGSCVVATACWIPLILFFITNIIFSMVRSGLSLDNIRIPPGYSRAEGAATRKDYPEALRLYREVADQYPEEPEPCRRMAEIHLLLNRPDEAIQYFREACAREPDSERKLVLTFAIAETLADQKKDLPGAVATLETFLTTHPDVKGKEFAEKRLGMLRARLQQNAR